MAKLFSLIALLLCCLVPNQGVADSQALTLAEKQFGNVAYVSGGIGDEERDEIRLRERDFNLKLLFAERDGSYIGNIDVVIVTAKGETVLEANAVGPFLLARLPKGNYVIKASMNGQLQQKKLSIVEKRKQEGVFRW